MHVCVCMSAYMDICVCMHVCVYVFLCAHVCGCMCVCMCADILIYVCVSVCLCVFQKEREERGRERTLSKFLRILVTYSHQLFFSVKIQLLCNKFSK